jgi:hypothetical protein
MISIFPLSISINCSVGTFPSVVICILMHKQLLTKVIFDEFNLKAHDATDTLLLVVYGWDLIFKAEQTDVEVLSFTQPEKSSNND